MGPLLWATSGREQSPWLLDTCPTGCLRPSTRSRRPRMLPRSKITLTTGSKKKKGYEDLTEWQKKRDAKYEKQGRGLGHEMVKSKYKGPKEEEKARGWFGERILTREYKESKGKGKK